MGSRVGSTGICLFLTALSHEDTFEPNFRIFIHDFEKCACRFLPRAVQECNKYVHLQTRPVNMQERFGERVEPLIVAGWLQLIVVVVLLPSIALMRCASLRRHIYVMK